jgi:hypothetical protein
MPLRTRISEPQLTAHSLQVLRTILTWSDVEDGTFMRPPPI